MVLEQGRWFGMVNYVLWTRRFGRPYERHGVRPRILRISEPERFLWLEVAKREDWDIFLHATGA